jgi:hypothetical protein
MKAIKKIFKAKDFPASQSSSALMAVSHFPVHRHFFHCFAEISSLTDQHH